MRVTKKPERQEYQVAIDKRMPSYLPFSCSPNRKKGWSMFKDLGNGGYCKAVACETINITDIISLLAMVKAFQDMPGKVRMSDVEFGTETKVLASLKMKHTNFLKRYIKHNNGAVLVNTLTRLLTYKVIWQGQKKNGRRGALDTTIFLYDFKISEAEHEITFLVAKGMLDYCQSNGWLVNLDKIQTLKSNAAQILALHFSAQKGGRYRQETLELVADLHSSQVDNRKILKKALTELQEGNFIGEFSAEKDKSGYLYTKEEITGHGFRAMARTILDEVLQVRPDFIEHQLAHAVKDPNGRAYNRTAHLEERRKMMQLWADYLDGLKAGCKVLPFKKAA